MSKKKDDYPNSLYKSKEDFLQEIIQQISFTQNNSQTTRLLISTSVAVLGIQALSNLIQSLESSIEDLANYLALPKNLLKIGGFVLGGLLGASLIGSAIDKLFIASNPTEQKIKEQIDAILKYGSSEYDHLEQLRNEGLLSQPQFKKEVNRLYDNLSEMLQSAVQEFE